MADIRYGHHTAEIDGDFVVFVIGARPSLRHPIRTFLDLGGRRGMTAMLKELSRDPEKGLLGFQSSGLLIVQYWRSFEHLEAFARDPGDLHRPAWLNYYRRAARHEGTGIWHETYLVRAGEYEAIYHNMPPHGLATAGRMVPLKEATTARLRLRRAVAG